MAKSDSTVANRSTNTRSAIVEASRTVIAQGGIKNLSMASVAQTSGLARATIYNHVRDKSELLNLVSVDFREEIVRIAHQAAQKDFLTAVITVAHFVATDPMLVTLRSTDPHIVITTLESVLQMSDDVAQPVMELLLTTSIHADLAAVEVVLRWLSSYCLVPGTAAEREVGAEILFHSLTQDGTK
jgi:AcrR family transcriptional regulator